MLKTHYEMLRPRIDLGLVQCTRVGAADGEGSAPRPVSEGLLSSGETRRSSND